MVESRQVWCEGVKAISGERSSGTTPVQDNINYRRHRGACPYYRENWSCESDPPAPQLLYQIICLMDTPPVTDDEQRLCMTSPNGCWRLKQPTRRRNGQSSY